MKFHLYLSFFLCCLWSFSVSAQQFPVRGQIIVPRPVPTATTGLIGRAGDPLLVLTNSSLQERQVMIGATISGDNGISGKIDPRRLRPRAPLRLPRLGTTTYTGDDLLAIFSNYTVFDINLSGIDIRSLIQNQLFPEGSYRICVQVYDFNTGELLSAAGSSCVGPLTVRTPDPPIILMPRANELLVGGDFQNFLFRWTPVNLGSAQPFYRIRIAEVPRGVNPYDAIDNDNLVRWEEEDLFKTSYLYDLSLPKLPAGEYAVQVTAYDPNGQVAIKNQGRSDVVPFRVTERQPRPPRLMQPGNRSQVPLKVPQAYAFSWRPPSGVQSPLEYRFRMVEIPSLAYANSRINDPAALIYTTETRNTRLFFRDPEPVLKLGQTYAWQVQVFDPAGILTFENDGYSDVYGFTIKEAQRPSPEIIAPEEDEIITVTRPFNLEIDWEHTVDPGLPVTYELGVWSYKDGNNPALIAQENDPVLLEQGLTETSFSTRNTTLEEGGKFFARVVASTTAEDVEFLNFGRSNYRIFEVEKTVTNHVLNLTCGEGCRYELPANTEPARLFGAGDTVRMGNFLLRLTDATQLQGDSYGGKAEIIPGNFFKAPVEVNLQNVRFTAAGIAFRGIAEATMSDRVDLPSAWTSSLDRLRLPADPQGTARRLEVQSRSVRASSGGVQTLPLEFNGVYLTYLRLLPTTATANLVNLQEFSGDRQVGSQFGLFAKRDVCFSAGGPAIAEEDAFLPLVNEVTIDRSAAYTITLLRRASDAPYGGTALPFSCEEATPEVHLAGYVTLRQEGLSQDGQPLASAPVYASFRATYENWLDWQAELHIRNVGNRASCCNDFTTATITCDQLPDYQLEIETMHLDHSSATNPEGLQLPVGHNGPDGELLAVFPAMTSIWNGLYLREAKWKLPAFAKKANGQRVSFPATNVVIDDVGLSAQNAFATDEFGLPIVLKDWTGQVNGSSIDIQANALETTTLKLAARIPAFEATVPITGEASWTNNRATWDF
ncbi:MAG: hypothetical protein AAF840_04190, partial [Bacteroidota bacterium]